MPMFYSFGGFFVLSAGRFSGGVGAFLPFFRLLRRTAAITTTAINDTPAIAAHRATLLSSPVFGDLLTLKVPSVAPRSMGG